VYQFFKQIYKKIVTIKPALFAGLGSISIPNFLIPNPGTVVNNFALLLVGVGGVIFFFLLLFGGIRLMLAGGDEKAAESARRSLTTGFIGLMIVVAAFFIAGLIGRILGVDILNINIPGIP